IGTPPARPGLTAGPLGRPSGTGSAQSCRSAVWRRPPLERVRTSPDSPVHRPAVLGDGVNSGGSRSHPPPHDGGGTPCAEKPLLNGGLAMEFVPEVTAYLENKPGRLAKICSALAQEKVDIRALSVMETEGPSVLRFVTTNLETTKAVLTSLG